MPLCAFHRDAATDLPSITAGSRQVWPGSTRWSSVQLGGAQKVPNTPAPFSVTRGASSITAAAPPVYLTRLDTKAVCRAVPGALLTVAGFLQQMPHEPPRREHRRRCPNPMRPRPLVSVRGSPSVTEYLSASPRVRRTLTMCTRGIAGASACSAAPVAISAPPIPTMTHGNVPCPPGGLVDRGVRHRRRPRAPRAAAARARGDSCNCAPAVASFPGSECSCGRCSSSSSCGLWKPRRREPRGRAPARTGTLALARRARPRPARLPPGPRSSVVTLARGSPIDCHGCSLGRDGDERVDDYRPLSSSRYALAAVASSPGSSTPSLAALSVDAWPSILRARMLRPTRVRNIRYCMR